MPYVKVPAPSEVYHLTKRENLDSILDDGKIRRFNDSECWFCEDLLKMKAYMEETVLCEGKPYSAVGGQLCHYPKFIPEDHVILKMTPRRSDDNWYRWDQEVPPGSPKEVVKAAREFSELKIGYRGDLSFCNAEIIDVPQFVRDGTVRKQPVQTSAELYERLREKVEKSQNDYMNRLYQMSPSQLISRAAEIEANRFCYNNLLTACIEREQLEVLAAADDPLEIVCDTWTSAQEVRQEKEFSQVLFELCDAEAQRQTMQMR